MSNTRHIANGVSAFYDGKPVDVSYPDALSVLGKSIAVELAQMLAEFLPRMPWQPECEPCVVAAKTAIRGYEVACRNAQAAGEDAPVLPEPPMVATAVTQQDSRWVCFDHVEISSGQPVIAP